MNKTFVTFPYPYMNGKLHLGHAYTLSKAVFYAEFRRLNGDDVLFPFAFHGTGMPIAASAAKIKYEQENNNNNNNIQTNILLDMGIKKEDIIKFINPEYWLEYFPNEAKKDLIKFGFNEQDFDRSFITTSLNPHYDAFIKWQFRKLINKGYIKHGSRYVIYSIKDGQPCADHDRIGSCEGIESKKYDTFLIFYNDYYFIVTGFNNDEKKIYYDPDTEYQSFECWGLKFVARKFAVLNLMYQILNITILNITNITRFEGLFPPSFIKSTTSITYGTGFINKNNQENNKDNIDYRWRNYYEPETEVISRSGDVCITALTDQWFINYGDPNIKEKVNDYIKNKFFCPDSSVVNQLLASSDWINEWPCSRNYGLGTTLPDTHYLIDSLSDSTIYMAYYTIAHIIKNINIDILKDDLIWDYIFMGINIDLNKFSEYTDQIKLMRDQFQYWYPVTLRVSGKDLVPNHLIMCLYNHYMIWDDFSFCPKSYCVNGYLMLNGKKMSKSEGNYMTLSEAVDIFGSDIVKISLCEKEGTEDGDFRNSVAKSYINKLADEKKFIIDMIDKIYNNNINNINNTNLWERLFSDELDNIMIKTYENYMNYKFRSVIYDGFHCMINCRNKYMNKSEKTNNLNYNLMKKFIEYILLILYPICPIWVNEIWEEYAENKINLSHKWSNTYKISNEYNRNKYYSDVIDMTYNMINNKKECLIEIISNYTDTELSLIDTVLKYYDYLNTNKLQDVRDNWNKYILSQNYDKSIIGKYAKFAAYVKTNIDQYGHDWLNYIKEDQSEYFIKLLPLLCPKTNIKFVVVKSDLKYEFKYGPGRVNAKVFDTAYQATLRCFSTSY